MIYTIFEKLCIQNHTTPTAVCKKITNSSGNLATWKNGNVRNDHLIQIADYFNVSVDYLLGRTDNPSAIPENLNHISSDSVILYHVIGAISAGYDGDSEFSPTGEELLVPKHLLKTHHAEDYFVLEVKGNSMYPLFMSGDKVLIRKCDSVDSGTVAAVGYNGEDATLKKVEYVQGKNWVRLIPRNPEYPTKIIKDADLEQCRVYGEVVYKFSDNVRF